MGEADVAVVLRGLEAFNRGDIDGLVALVDPEVVWEEGGVVFPDMPPAYHGPEGVRRWYQEAVLDAWEEFRAELLELRDEGDGNVVQLYRVLGRGRGSGVPVDMPVVQTLTVRGGRIRHRRIERAPGSPTGARGEGRDLRTAHTADLGSAALRAARALLDDVFGDEMTDDDWDHALGGVHAVVWEGGELVAHASVVRRELLYDGRALRTGYIEAVAVRADRRRRGHAAAMMDALERVIRGGYALGALGASDEGVAFYAARGWEPWRGPLSALTPTGKRPTPEEAGSVCVLPVAEPLDVSRELTCDWRDGELW